MVKFHERKEKTGEEKKEPSSFFGGKERGFLLDATSVFLVCSELLELMQAEVAFLNASLIPDVFPILLDASSKTIIAKSRDL
ncbi:hypothetical protein ACS0TY_014251 [Phlomoides rotata]